jgi:hypothetical protein
VHFLCREYALATLGSSLALAALAGVIFGAVGCTETPSYFPPCVGPAACPDDAGDAGDGGDDTTDAPSDGAGATDARDS